jgi:hypothetical protein
MKHLQKVGTLRDPEKLEKSFTMKENENLK